MTKLPATPARNILGHRSETVRRANLSAIATALHLYGPLSRTELASRTGLTRTAIRELIAEFIATGLAREERGTSLGVRGRPSPLVRPDPRRAVVLALEIAVDSLAAAVVGFGGTVLERRRVERQRADFGVVDIVDDLGRLARPLLGRLRREDALLGVGVAVVGMVSRFDGSVRLAPNLGWRDVPLGRLVADSLDLRVPLSVANEADLGALAEHRRGAGIGIDNVVFISGEVGVGGGIIVDGRPLTGDEGYAGEIGHVPVNPAGLICGCGSVGCWETEIGEQALLRRARRSENGGRASVELVLAAARAGGRPECEALAEAGRWIGFGLAGIVNAFNPRVVILGGLFARIYPFVVETVERELDRRALAAPRERVRLLPAVVGADAPLIGAAELAFEPLLVDPAAWFATGVDRVRKASA